MARWAALRHGQGRNAEILRSAGDLPRALASRRRGVLERKDKPFAPDGTIVTGGTTPAPTPADEETGAEDDDAQNL